MRCALELLEVVRLCAAPVMLYMLEVLEVMRCVLFCMLEVVEGDRCLRAT